MKDYLNPTFYMDSDHPGIMAFARHHSKGYDTPIKKAVALYYAVRDRIRYNPYAFSLDKNRMKASAVLAQGQGYCVGKAVLLAACLRAVNIPARLGFADVKNHLTTERLRKRMGTDIFYWHGYTDIFLGGKWVKATPAFNIELCQAFGVKSLEFDGKADSIFHPYDAKGNRHMEYIRDHGGFSDLPWEEILSKSAGAYPDFFKQEGIEKEDFRDQALAEKDGA